MGADARITCMSIELTVDDQFSAHHFAATLPTDARITCMGIELTGDDQFNDRHYANTLPTDGLITCMPIGANGRGTLCARTADAALVFCPARGNRSSIRPPQWSMDH